MKDYLIILVEVGGRIHGSQSHYLDEELRIVVYYEVPNAEQREEVKSRFRSL